MQQSTFSGKSNICEGKTIRIIAEEPESPGIITEGLVFTGLEIPRDYNKGMEGLIK